MTFGSELADAATHLPRTPKAIAAYLQRKLGSANGAAMIDEALKKLKAAGYGAS
jgi:DNA-binding phage protein